MLTHLHIRGFKRFDSVDIELGQAVVLIGPNNCGKTTALQALALWDIGLKRWTEKRGGTSAPEKRPGVTINVHDLISMPVPQPRFLWRNTEVRNVTRIEGKQITQNIRIDITVEGITAGKSWSCGLEFDYSTEQSFHCRPLRIDESKPPERMTVPKEAAKVQIAYLPPMSGLAADEPKLEPGRVNVLIGEGQTAQVLRNLCFQIYARDNQPELWQNLVSQIKQLFGAELLPPQYNPERGEITMAYQESGRKKLDISCSGRGLQQTLLLLAYLYANPNSVLLLDEPDAHLEILRQRQIYRLLTDLAAKQGSQIIAASHSEVLLNEAADRDILIAFVGKPHRINDRGSQVLKALRDIGFDQYYQAEQTGWVLYLEGSTDLDILRTFAESLEHEDAMKCLERPFVCYVGNKPKEASRHFWGLSEAKSDLVGVALFDRLGKDLPADLGVVGLQWRRREIENYLCMPEVLLAYAQHNLPDDSFGPLWAQRRVEVMKKMIQKVGDALKTIKRLDPWSADIKVTDDFLDPLFDKYFEMLELPNLLRKSGYYTLAKFVPPDRIDPEIKEKLDAIVEVAQRAQPIT